MHFARSPWSSPPTTPSLPGAGVHVWRFSLAPPGEKLRSLQAALSAEELQRAGRFRFERDRIHFTAARGSLRSILSGYLGVPAGRVTFNYSSYGKPHLGEEYAGEGISFNLSHAGELGLLAVAAGRQVGIDIEQIRPDFAGEEIARRFFSAYELAELLDLPVPSQVEAFFTCWTRKEAFIKAVGEGLSMPLDRFDVSLYPGRPAVLVATRPDLNEAARWSLQHLEPGPGYVGALAIKGPLGPLSCWDWV